MNADEMMRAIEQMAALEPSGEKEKLFILRLRAALAERKRRVAADAKAVRETLKFGADT